MTRMGLPGGSALVFFADPAAFLSEAGHFLAREPVVNTVVNVVTHRAVTEDAAGVPRDPAAPRWWVLARDASGEVVGVGMRTATAPPYALYLLPMPDSAARELGAVLVGRNEAAPRINGSLPSALACAEEIGRRTGGTALVDRHSRLFECTELVLPTMPPGRLRPAELSDAQRCLDWFTVFHAEADAQAGREGGGASEVSAHSIDDMRRRIEGGRILLWETPGGEVVHLTGVSAPAFGVSRIGPVYTPAEHRGRGYASAAVALATQAIFDVGARACLFTDQANPTSNGIYQAMGYRAVADTGDVVIE